MCLDLGLSGALAWICLFNRNLGPGFCLFKDVVTSTAFTNPHGVMVEISGDAAELAKQLHASNAVRVAQ